MIYVTGGAAFGEVDTNVATTTTTVAGVTPAAAFAYATRVGWTVGAGTEWAIWGGWSAKLEYLYVDLGTVSNTFTGIVSFPAFYSSSHFTDNIVRVGLNYRFGGPVVAKY